jgi:TolB-like protein
MKRCPTCHRVEDDEALKFCRIDGATLVNDASAIESEAGTAQLGSLPGASEGHTNILPDSTDANISRATAPTTVLPPQPLVKTSSLAKSKRQRLVIALIALAAITTIAGYFYFARKSNASIQSIAVMPFVNASGNADIEYLSDGMTESLINSLSQLPNLSVKARSMVFQYKGKDANPQQVGSELSVQAVLNGRVTQRGDQLTLSLEMVDARTGNQIWGEQYNRKTADLVSLQSEIARDVSSKLITKLSGADQARLAKTYTTDPEAYRLYLQGRFCLNKRTGKIFDLAEGYFQQAIARDPNFALGYVGLAQFLSGQDRPKAKEYILRALAIDNQLSEAHASLGYQFILDYDFAPAERELKRAIELDANNFRAYQWNGQRLMMIGLYDQSLAQYDRAIEMEPMLADIRMNHAICVMASGKIDAAVEELKQAMQIDPEFVWVHSVLSYTYRLKGDHAASVEERARAAEVAGQPDKAKATREAFAKGGWTAYLRELLRQGGDREGNSVGRNNMRSALQLAELGEKEEALNSLTGAAANGDWWLFSIKFDPAFNSLRSDPRFQALVKKFDPPK